MTHNTILQGTGLIMGPPGSGMLIVQCSCGVTLVQTAELMDLSEVNTISSEHHFIHSLKGED